MDFLPLAVEANQAFDVGAETGQAAEKAGGAVGQSFAVDSPGVIVLQVPPAGFEPGVVAGVHDGQPEPGGNGHGLGGGRLMEALQGHVLYLPVKIVSRSAEGQQPGGDVGDHEVNGDGAFEVFGCAQGHSSPSGGRRLSRAAGVNCVF